MPGGPLPLFVWLEIFGYFLSYNKCHPWTSNKHQFSWAKIIEFGVCRNMGAFIVCINI